jgi:CBS domain-containing protein
MEVTSINSSIRDAAQAVLVSRCRTTFVVDDDRVLHGSVTEGDLVRAFLRGLNLDASVRHIMNTNPVFVLPDYEPKEASSLMTSHGHSAIPVVDDHRKLLHVLKQTDV